MINLQLNELIPPNFQSEHVKHVDKFFENSFFDYTEKQVEGYTKDDNEIYINVGYMMKTFTYDAKTVSLCMCMIRPLIQKVDK